MIEQSESFRAIPKERVIELCSKKLELIKKVRKQEDEEYYLTKRKKIVKRNFFRRIISERWETLEEFSDRYISSVFDDWSYPSLFGWKSIDICEKLLKLAKEESGATMINVSCEDFNRIV